MSNRRERATMDRLDGVIREIGSLTPQNPADIRAISTNLRLATTASKALSAAIVALRADDWAGVNHHLGRAERIVKRDQGSGDTNE